MSSKKIEGNPALNNLMKNLFFPAILGAMTYDLISNLVSILVGDGGKNCNWNFDHELGYVKFALSILLIIFYCIDYLYIVEKKNYGLKIFILDICVLACISTIYLGLRLDLKEPYETWVIVGPHFLYAGFFTCYDYCLAKKKGILSEAKALYLGFARFQLRVTVVLFDVLLITYRWKETANWLAGISLGLVLVISSQFYGKKLKDYQKVQYLLQPEGKDGKCSGQPNPG